MGDFRLGRADDFRLGSSGDFRLGRGGAGDFRPAREVERKSPHAPARVTWGKGRRSTRRPEDRDGPMALLAAGLRALRGTREWR